MAEVRPFQAVRPRPGLEKDMACLPYDVMNRDEARKMAHGNPHSFLRVVRAEIDLDDAVNPYDDSVYRKGRETLDRMIAQGDLVQDEAPCFYVYQQEMEGRVQTGLVGCCSIDEYMDDRIKKHEFTREAKELDRIRHFDACDANTEPIFLTYRNQEELADLVRDWTVRHPALYDFTAEDGISHRVWKIDDGQLVEKIGTLFSGVEYLYIADGHHRSASAAKVGLRRREANPGYTGTEEFNRFMAVIFPDRDLHVMDYNRVVRDLNGRDPEAFLAEIAESFDVEPWEGDGPCRPDRKHRYGMYLEGRWYRLDAREGSYDASHPVRSLDASILQENLLRPVLGIEDPRTDERIDFVGGIRGLGELEERVRRDMTVAFSLYPTSMEDLLAVADAGEVMPPKSTWFEPKLRSGLLIHRLS